MMYLRKRNSAAFVVTSLVFALLLASCTGNGSSGSQTIGGVSLSPLIVADRVSVVDPQNSNPKPSSKTAAPAPTGIKALLAGLNIITTPLAPSTDYMKDVTTVYVNERSVEAFQNINSILCSVRQTRYDAMINQGPYLALVDEKSCRNEASSSTDQSSNAGMPQYSLWTVKSSRASETSPHIVDVWLFDPYQDAKRPNGQLITAQMIITESVDTAPPYGKFQINYIATDPLIPSIEIVRGMLRSEPNPQTGEALLQLAEETPDFFNIMKTTLLKNANGSGGGTVLQVRNDPAPTTDRFDIAFSTDFFSRHNYDGSPDVCFDRTTFDESAWRYGLYDQSGMRINVNAGFSIKRGSDYGWVGYWGYWMPNNPDGSPGVLSDGETVYEHNFSTNVDTPYTVFLPGGKLKRHSRKLLNLVDIKSIPLVWNDGGTNYLVVWEKLQPTDTEGYFIKVATQDNNGNWAGITPALINLPTLPLYTAELNFWSQSLGGQMRVSLANCAPPGASAYYTCPVNQPDTAVVTYYAETIVRPGEAGVPQSLACYDRCPQAGTAAGIDPTANPLPFYNTWNGTTSVGYDYSFATDPADPNTMVLIDKTSSNPVVLASKSSDPGYEWGVSSGPLFDNTIQANMDVIKCDWTLTGQICGWESWYLDEFFTWETGPNSWNQFMGLKDGAGNFVRFDEPLRVLYTHIQPVASAPDYKYNNVKFNLEYSGFGNLQGIPGACVDINMQPATCDQSTHWVPEFTIPDMNPLVAGELSEVTDSNDNITKYIVKALEKEQRMRAADLSGDPTILTPCTNASVTPAPYPLPSMTLWNAPTSGRRPNITSAPKVIGGVVQ